MNKLLKELRSQRDLIRRHLEWLESQIAELEAGDSAETNDSKLPKAEEPSRETKEETPNNDSEEVENDVEDTAPQLSQEDDEAEKYLETYKPPTGNDVRAAKIGCFVFFILGTGLFLFLLFGLPYLLD